MKRRYLEAIALVNVSDVARQTGRALRTLRTYMQGSRNVTVPAARELIAYLHSYAHRLTVAADRLEAAMMREEGND